MITELLRSGHSTINGILSFFFFFSPKSTEGCWWSGNLSFRSWSSLCNKLNWDNLMFLLYFSANPILVNPDRLHSLQRAHVLSGTHGYAQLFILFIYFVVRFASHHKSCLLLRNWEQVDSTRQEYSLLEL